jgi:hypothetical protein
MIDYASKYGQVFSAGAKTERLWVFADVQCLVGDTF